MSATPTRCIRAIQFLLPMLLLGLVSACSNSSSGGGSTQPTVTEVNVTPASAQLPAGTQTALTVIATFSNGNTLDVTELASWVSADESVATVDDSLADGGTVTGVAEGVTDVFATYENRVDSAVITVTPATLSRIEVSPTSATIAAGTTQAFQATAIFSDNHPEDVTEAATWSSDDTDVAAVSNAEGSSGVASGLTMGSANITAVYQGQQASAELTVSSAVVTDLAITPVNMSVHENRSVNFVATATFSDESTQDVTDSTTWTSSSQSVATISNTAPDQGKVTPVTQGTTQISGQFQDFTDTTSLTVTAPVAVEEVTVTPADASIPEGTTQQYTATATYADGQSEVVTTEATWASSVETVATVSNAAGSKGLAEALSSDPDDTTQISATFLDVTGMAPLVVLDAVLESITVTPVNPSVPAGSTLEFVAKGSFSDGSSVTITDSVVWSSSNTNTATISNGADTKGLASANAQGTTTITAASGDISGTTTMTVTAATLQSIAVEPSNQLLANGYWRQYSATGLFSDGTHEDITASVTWSVTDPALATASNTAGSKGRVTAADMGTGDLLVRATQSGVTGQTGLEVTNEALSDLQVDPDPKTLAEGEQQQYTATGVFEDPDTLATRNQDLTNQVTWSSSNTGIATVSTGGLVVAKSAGGPIDIVADDSVSAFQGVGELTVNDAEVVSVTVTPTNASVPDGAEQQYTAMGTFTDGKTDDVTTTVDWSSSDTSVATISNDPGSEGLATAVAVGDTLIIAVHPDRGATRSVPLEVTAKELVSIAIDGADADDTIADGQTNDYTAMGTYTDGSMDDVTTQVTWQSSSTAVATISNAAGSEGEATGQSPGSTNITATLDGVTSNVLGLTVTDADLVSVAISPSGPTSIAKGTSQAFTAMGTYTDGSEADLTTEVTWSSSDTDVASISNADGSEGVAFAKMEGSTTITAATTDASGDPVTDDTTLTVTEEELVSISISPPGTSEVPVDFQLQLTATGTYTDGSTQDLTDDPNLSWSSFDSDVATVSGDGLVTGIAAGSTSILAQMDDVQATKGITVTEATLTSITISNDDADNEFGGIGNTIQFFAEGTFDSGLSGFDLTTQVAWDSSDPAVCTIDASGEATAIAFGSSTISASRDGVDSNEIVVTNTP